MGGFPYKELYCLRVVACVSCGACKELRASKRHTTRKIEGKFHACDNFQPHALEVILQTIFIIIANKFNLSSTFSNKRKDIEEGFLV